MGSNNNGGLDVCCECRVLSGRRRARVGGEGGLSRKIKIISEPVVGLRNTVYNLR